MGKWNYEVSNLSAFEKAAVKIIYGGLPAASLNNSIMYYEKAKSLAPLFTLNYLELAKAYHKNDDDTKAISLLKLPAFYKEPNRRRSPHKSRSAKTHKKLDVIISSAPHHLQKL